MVIGRSFKRLPLEYQKGAFVRLALGVIPLVLDLTGTELGAHWS
jgi:hypothetical protein